MKIPRLNLKKITQLKLVRHVRKLNQKFFLNASAALLLIAFVFFGVKQYQQVDRYLQALKFTKDKAGPVDQPPLPSKSQAFGLERKDLFSSIRGVKIKPKPTPQDLSFIMLGVVKKNILYIVAEFKRDKKIKIFAQGEKVDGDWMVKELDLKNVTIQRGEDTLSFKVNQLRDKGAYTRDNTTASPGGAPAAPGNFSPPPVNIDERRILDERMNIMRPPTGPGPGSLPQTRPSWPKGPQQGPVAPGNQAPVKKEEKKEDDET